MPINFVQSGKTLQLKTNSPQLNLHSQETKVDLKKQEEDGASYQKDMKTKKLSILINALA